MWPPPISVPPRYSKTGAAYEPEVVFLGRGFTRRAEEPDGREVLLGHGAPRAPCPYQRGDDAQYRDPSFPHEAHERGLRGSACMEGHRRAVQEARVDEPRTHHPADARGPGNDVLRVNVLVEVSVHPALERRDVGPGNRLRGSCRSRGEEYVRDLIGRGNVGFALVVVRQDVLPRQVAALEFLGVDDDGARFASESFERLAHLGVESELAPAAPIARDRDRGAGAADRHPPS